MNETNEKIPYIYPALDELKSYQRLQFIVWGLESLEKELWRSAERGWHDTTGPEFQSFVKLLRDLYNDKADSLTKHNHEVVYDEMLEQASMMW